MGPERDDPAPGRAGDRGMTRARPDCPAHRCGPACGDRDRARRRRAGRRGRDRGRGRRGGPAAAPGRRRAARSPRPPGRRSPIPAPRGLADGAGVTTLDARRGARWSRGRHPSRRAAAVARVARRTPEGTVTALPVSGRRHGRGRAGVAARHAPGAAQRHPRLGAAARARRLRDQPPPPGRRPRAAAAHAATTAAAWCCARRSASARTAGRPRAAGSSCATGSRATRARRTARWRSGRAAGPPR